MFVGMALATYFTRYAMIAALGQELPSLLRRWLRYVPTAILAALITPAALAPEGHLAFDVRVWVVLAGVGVAWRTRNSLWTVLGGMVTFYLLQLLGV
jgi:branched-subunit amino acid transport protein